VRVLVVTNLLATFVRTQVEGLRRIGLDVEQLYLDRTNLGRRVYLEVRRLVRRAVHETRPDVVHVMYGGVMADIVTRTIRTPPVVVTFYGSDLLGGIEATSALRRLPARYGVLASRRAAGRAAAIITQSREMALALPTRDRARAWVIPDGIDMTVFAPRDRLECQQELRWDPSLKHVLFPSSKARPEKRFELAQAAIELVDRPQRRVELHELVGVTHDGVPVWLNGSDAIVLTSTHEGSPNVVKEALACDVAVVSVDVGDVRERIDGIDGCLLAEPTPEDIAAKLDIVLERVSRVEARERMAELSLEHVAQRLYAVYRSVTDGVTDR
jgi:teichuronic acid biosynthesis glycosyltransferase TuaC